MEDNIKTNKTKRKSSTNKKVFEKRLIKIYAILAVLILFAVVPILLIVLGLDKKVFGSTINGTVTDDQGNQLEGVQVGIQEKMSQTDQNGYFQIEELKYGIYEISLSKNGYLDYREEIKLSRFDNKLNFQMQQLDFGEMTFDLEFDGDTFYSEGFVASINDQSLEVKSKQVLSGKLITGEYTLKIASPYYRDIDKDVDIKPGISQVEIFLEPSADLLFVLKDYLTGEDIEADRIQISDNEEYVDIDEEGISKSQVSIKDIDISKVGIRVFKEKYKEYKNSIDLKQGTNSLDIVYLVPEGRFISVAEKDGQNVIRISDYNGENYSQVYSSDKLCNIVEQSTSWGTAKCGNFYVSVTFSDASSNLSSLEGYENQYIYADMAKGAWIVVDNSLSKKITIISDKEYSFFEQQENVTSARIVGSRVIFTSDSSIYTSDLNGENINSVSDGSFKIVDISPDGSLSLLVNGDGQGRNIWLLDNNSLEKRKVSFIPADYRDVQFIDNNNFVFIKSVSNRPILFRQSISSSTAGQIVDQVDQVRFIKNSQILVLKINQQEHLYSLTTGKLT